MSPGEWVEVMKYLLIAFGIGASYTTLQWATKTNTKNINGLGKKARDMEALALRRWLQNMATDLDEVDSPAARKVAKQLREESWRS